jgi:hypothetical protein
MTAIWRTSLLLPLVMSAAACGGDDDGGSGGNPAEFDPDTDYAPAVDTTQLSADVDNPLFPLPVGATWMYEAPGEDGLEEIVVTVEADTIEVWGAEVRVVRDTASIDGEMIEDTRDWYAQDRAGNVWYLGEDTTEYAKGKPPSKAGSFEAGVRGAQAGVAMPAHPRPGMSYRQEYLKGEAEDRGRVLSVDARARVPFGSFANVLKTEDSTPLEPTATERKYYARNVGSVLEVGVSTKARAELVAFERRR